MKVLTIAHICLFDASIVCNVLPLVLLPLQVESSLLVVAVAVLVNNALSTAHILFTSRLFPPIIEVSCMNWMFDVR